MNDLEIAIYRGMYTPLPSSPPPPYTEKETVSIINKQANTQADGLRELSCITDLRELFLLVLVRC